MSLELCKFLLRIFTYTDKEISIALGLLPSELVNLEIVQNGFRSPKALMFTGPLFKLVAWIWIRTMCLG